MILEAKLARIVVMLAAVAGSCLAGEYAVLSSGFRVHADRHEIEGSTVRLYAKGGMTEFPAAQITAFETEEDVPKPPSQATAAERPSSAKELITHAAKRHGLPPEFVHSVVAAESAYRPDAVSRKGAIGLMQLMPGTAHEYGADPRDPKQNVEAGTKYLRDLLLKYDGRVSRALAAYNAGPGAVDRYRGVPPYRETRAYVARVVRQYEKAAAAKQTAD